MRAGRNGSGRSDGDGVRGGRRRVGRRVRGGPSGATGHDAARSASLGAGARPASARHRSGLSPVTPGLLVTRFALAVPLCPSIGAPSMGLGGAGWEEVSGCCVCVCLLVYRCGREVFGVRFALSRPASYLVYLLPWSAVYFCFAGSTFWLTFKHSNGDLYHLRPVYTPLPRTSRRTHGPPPSPQILV